MDTDSKYKTLYYKYKNEILAHEETRKRGQQTRFELMLEIKRKDQLIDVLNEQIGNLLSHRYKAIDDKFDGK